ncbi:hypothetical protein BCR34DRAFT_592361 [Clohesyomyces aquaticus]|uniref:BZIP domain-containing protein n=1 Tax=Clohesyomyces aquaticus TaxID=1231657 RepID=A0A1Y1YSU8_9PLEO|nr:hypothetical protein BCR34DRAFT_592361 [Clohesyomyces aquaticus]
MSSKTRKSQSKESEENNEDDWSHISDRQERKRIQNRLAQRNYRKNMKERIEALERAAAETATSSARSASDERGTASPANYHGARLDNVLWEPFTMPLGTRLQLNHRDMTVSSSTGTRTPDLDQTPNPLRNGGDGTFFDPLMDDPRIQQFHVSDEAFGLHDTWNGLSDTTLFSNDVNGNSMSLHTARGPNASSGSSPMEQQQFGFGLRAPSSNRSSPADIDFGTLGLQDISMPGVEFHSLRRPAALHRRYTGGGSYSGASTSSSREGSRHRPTTPSSGTGNALPKRKRASRLGSDADYELDESNVLSGSESEDVIPRSSKSYLSGHETSSSSSSSLPAKTGRDFKASQTSHTYKNSSVQKVNPAPENQSTRVASALGQIKPIGFTSIEDLCTQFWTADLTDRPSLADSQRLSRRRELPQMLSKLREASNEWTDWEAQGWRDEVTRSAETVLVDECQRYLRKEDRMRLQNDETQKEEELLRLKCVFQEKVGVVATPSMILLIQKLLAPESVCTARFPYAQLGSAGSWGAGGEQKAVCCRGSDMQYTAYLVVGSRKVD